MTPRIQKAIDIFLDALNEGTLAKGTCAACAVGNLVAASQGEKIYRDGVYFKCEASTNWADIFLTFDGSQRYRPNLIDDFVLKEAEATGFTLDELRQIEYAFEANTCINFMEYWKYSKQEVLQDQIRGLEAVVKVMLTFDEQKDDVKEVFTNKLSHILCVQ